jgi:hypothetical protein
MKPSVSHCACFVGWQAHPFLSCARLPVPVVSPCATCTSPPANQPRATTRRVHSAPRRHRSSQGGRGRRTTESVSPRRHGSTCHGPAWCLCCVCVPAPLCLAVARRLPLSVCSLSPTSHLPTPFVESSTPFKTAGGTGGKEKEERTEKPRTHATHRQGHEDRTARSTPCMRFKESCPALWPRPFARAVAVADVCAAARRLLFLSCALCAYAEEGTRACSAEGMCARVGIRCCYSYSAACLARCRLVLGEEPARRQARTLAAARDGTRSQAPQTDTD